MIINKVEIDFFQVNYKIVIKKTMERFVEHVLVVFEYVPKIVPMVSFKKKSLKNFFLSKMSTGYEFSILETNPNAHFDKIWDINTYRKIQILPGIFVNFYRIQGDTKESLIPLNNILHSDKILINYAKKFNQLILVGKENVFIIDLKNNLDKNLLSALEAENSPAIIYYNTDADTKAYLESQGLNVKNGIISTNQELQQKFVNLKGQQFNLPVHNFFDQYMGYLNQLQPNQFNSKVIAFLTLAFNPTIFYLTVGKDLCGIATIYHKESESIKAIFLQKRAKGRKCPICNYNFDFFPNFFDHVMKKHDTPQNTLKNLFHLYNMPYSCECCGELIENEKKYNDHISNHHIQLSAKILCNVLGPNSEITKYVTSLFEKNKSVKNKPYIGSAPVHTSPQFQQQQQQQQQQPYGINLPPPVAPQPQPLFGAFSPGMFVSNSNQAPQNIQAPFISNPINPAMLVSNQAAPPPTPQNFPSFQLPSNQPAPAPVPAPAPAPAPFNASMISAPPQGHFNPAMISPSAAVPPPQPKVKIDPSSISQQTVASSSSTDALSQRTRSQEFALKIATKKETTEGVGKEFWDQLEQLELSTHGPIDISADKFKCSLCKEKFLSAVYLLQHTWENHKDVLQKSEE